MKKITKAVFPVAGLGTRFLPATKASPKEMLPIVDIPLIQYAAEEAIAAGVTELVFVTGRNKRSIPDHFDTSFELEAKLEASGKAEVLEAIRKILPKGVSCIYIRQPEALGLGHAVLCAKPVVGNEPFAVILADDLIDGTVPCMQQMTALFDKTGSSILGVEDVAPSETGSYGIVDTAGVNADVAEVKSIVEKPRPEDAPSTLAVVGRYVLTPKIFDLLEQVKPGKGGEIQLTDAISALLQYEKVLAYRFAGKRYDCGSKLGYMKANVEFALRHPEIGAEFAEYLKQVKV
ncbi:MAG: UTP--glucose-1-phosphate uridylyltransferase [Betaproteobacteria bacterium HGW-Betaproteobacteria-1]|nr:MAG: UTP--glucose-1-phosphate uridylyltransferase [Betaproteobacteria bacterium HGW-Betaproteobacteria-1]